MKKLLFFFALLFMGAMTVFAQVPTNQQLTYQTVVRTAQNQLVFSQNNVSVLVEVCKADGSVVWYRENHTGLSTNANGLLTLMVGSSTSHTGNWADIDWSDAAIRTTITYDPGTGTVTIPSGLAPISAVPYALQAGNASNITNLIGDAIHDSIVNNISSQIHDTVTNYLTNNNYVTETVMGSAIHDSITNNVTSTISNQIHDSIADINSELTALTDRVNTFNTHVCDSVKDCVTGWIHDSIASNIADNVSDQIHDSITNYLTNNNYVTETVMGSAIHDSITNNVTNTISSQIHDSIVNISGDLTDLENRVNTFNTHVCDSVKDCVTGWIHDSIANNIADNVSEQIHDSIVNHLTNNNYVTETVMGSAIHDSITNNVTNTISSQIHDSIVNISGDLTDLENRVNTFNTHVCDSVKDCIKDYLNDNHYVTETVMGSAIHDSITNNVTNTISSQIHDSIVNISGDLTDLENRVNTFNTHVCDSVKDCVTGWIHDSIANNISDNISSQIHDSLVYNINNTISEQIHDSVSNYLTNNHYVTESNLCSTIETNCTNVALRSGNTFTGDHDFTGAGAVTVPNAVTPDLATALASTCTQKAVNLCDLIAVFDSLNRRINSVYDSLQRLNDELTALKNTIPPVASAPTVSNVTSSSMNVKANATSDGAAITSYEFCISANSDMSGATCQTVQASDADNYTFTGLTPNTNYYVQYSATNFAGTSTSASVLQRTPAHAPTANEPPTLETAKPAGFKVEVTGIDPKEKDDATTVQVCYTPNTGTCPDKESADYTACKTVDATGVSDTTISVTGLTPSTEYCAIVKVSNGDSTSIYGPYTVTTGDDVTMTITQPGSGTIGLCSNPSVNVTYTATPSDGGSYTYSWSGSPASASGTTATYSYTSAGTYTVTVTATHTSPDYTLTATASTTVSNGGTAATLKLCEDPSIGKVLVDNTNCTSLSWKNSSNVEVSTSLTELVIGGEITAGVYTVTGMNASGCSIEKQTVLGTYTPKPCTAASMGSHSVQTTGTGNDYDGKETAVNDSIISVKDYDGNEYPVVEINSQCWMAVNLRATHYSNGDIVPAGTTSNSSTTDPYYYDYAPTSPEIPFEQRGYLYNWPAVMKSPSDPSTAEGARGICPTGWHVPTRTDWQTMVAAAEASTSTGAVYLSSSCKWNGSTSGTGGMTPNSYDNPDRNKSGFSAVPAGYFYGSSFHNAGLNANFWSSSVIGSYSWYRALYYVNAHVREYDNYRSNGFSVRCVRD